MSTNLPLEMDFVHETYNARRAEDDFKKVGKTTLYIPEVLRCTKRTMVMEFIEGARVTEF
jgi:aarF domain-containing kinase